MTRPRLLDLFCCEGGAAVGYDRAGFEVFGMDREAKYTKRYPFWFTTGDAIDALRRLIRGEKVGFADHHAHYQSLGLADFDAIHASPPCQAHTRAQKIMGRRHADLIAPIRELLHASGRPFVIENVIGAPLVKPQLLCGAMFSLETYRHRLFETNFDWTPPSHPAHVAKTTKMGRPPRDGEYMHIVGNFSGVDRAREVMEMPWASRDGLREAIPPAYTEHIGRQLIHALEGATT